MPLSSINPQVSALASQAALDACLLRMALAIPKVSNAAKNDADELGFLKTTLTKPFVDAGASIVASFKADPLATTADFLQLVSDITARVSGSFPQNHDHGQVTLQTFLMDGGSLASMLIFALEENEPLVKHEMDQLRHMKKIVRRLVEECSKLPDKFIPELPFFAAAHRICEAEHELKDAVGDTLKLANIAEATVLLAEARDIVKAGAITVEDVDLLVNGLGLTAEQVTKIIGLRFSPDPICHRLVARLVKLNEFVQQADGRLAALTNNVRKAKTDFASAKQVQLKEALGLMLGAVYQSVVDLNSSLDAEISAFQRDIPALLAGNSTSTEVTLHDPAVLYAELHTLVLLLSRVRALYDRVAHLVDKQYPTTKFLLDLADKHLRRTGDSQAVGEATQAFVIAVNTRLVGRGGDVGLPAKALITAIDAHLKYLHYVEAHVEKTRVDAPAVISGATGLIASMLRAYPQLREAIVTLDLAALTGISGAEYSALMVLIEELSCLIKHCPNAFTQALARRTQDALQSVLARRRSAAITMDALGQLPRAAQEQATAERVKELDHTLSTLQRFLSGDVEAACRKVAIVT